MSAAKLLKRIERLESICGGADFLLTRLLKKYDDDLSLGMIEQIKACIHDCRQAKAAQERRAQVATGE